MKYYLLLIFKVFFLLSLSAAISLFLTSFGIFGYVAFIKSDSLTEAIISTTKVVFILNKIFGYSGFVILFGFMFAWPAIYLFSFPYCLYLKFNNVQGFLRWVIPLTFIGLIYSLFINYIFSYIITNFKQPAFFWISIFTGTAFMTSVGTWFFCNKLSFTLDFGLSKPDENFRYYLIKNVLKIKSYFRGVIWPEIKVFRHIDLYIAWRWLIVLFFTLSICLYVAQLIYLITFPVTYGGLRKYIDVVIGFLFAPVILVIGAYFYIVLLYILSIILMSKQIKNLYAWILSFTILGAMYSIISYLINIGWEAEELYRDLIFILTLIAFISSFAMRYIYIKSNIDIIKKLKVEK